MNKSGPDFDLSPEENNVQMFTQYHSAASNPCLGAQTTFGKTLPERRVPPLKYTEGYRMISKDRRISKGQLCGQLCVWDNNDHSS